MYNLLKLNLGRNSLRYIIRNYKISEMYIPYYICPAIRRALISEKCRPVFYHIDNNFMITDDLPKDSYILYPNYFGVCDKNVEILSQKYEKLIVDNSHSFYSEPTGFASFNSARKFLPVFYGSFLWIKEARLSLDFENSPVSAPKNEEEFLHNEILFENLEPKFIEDNLADRIESFNLKEKRKEIFLELHKTYGEKNLLKIDLNCQSPFCYPLLAKTHDDANEIAFDFINRGYDIYRYWEELPSDYPESKFYERLVPIPLEL